MGIENWRKWILVILFFSLALNFGFAYTAASWKFRPPFIPPPPGPPPMGPGPMGGPARVLHIIDEMTLPHETRDKVKSMLRDMDTEHHEFIRALFEEEKKILELIGKPGTLELEMITPLIKSYSQIREKSALNKAGHIVEIRKLLGREKSIYLISEIKKQLRKRAPWDKPQD